MFLPKCLLFTLSGFCEIKSKLINVYYIHELKLIFGIVNSVQVFLTDSQGYIT